ncbi:MAG: hypothetical protein EP346_06975 [Bacteroidetes bacterium]|nr:MAG: hypothetical protein EP346_06975 [Bacteroidota bacterium]
MRASLFIAIICAAVGCCPTKSITVDERHEVKTRDSLVVREIVTLDTIHIEQVDVSTETPLEDLTPGFQASTSNDRATVSIDISKEGIVTTSCVCDSLEVYARSLERELLVYRSSFERKESEKTTVTTPWYLRAHWVYVGVLLFIVLAIFIYRKYKNIRSWIIPN